MPSTVTISDGTTTLDLTAAYLMVQRYAIQTPQPRMGATTGQSTNDLALSPWEYQDVTESIELLLMGPDRATNQSLARTIQKILEAARLRQKTGMGERCFVRVQLDSESDEWRSEILAGRLLIQDAHDELPRLKLNAVLSITRRYYWEGPREAITLSSSEDTSATTVDIYNNDDATPAATNYISINGAVQIDGVLPTPIELKLTNDSGATLSWREFFITNWVTPGSDIPDAFLLGSEAVGGPSYSLTTAEAAAWRWELGDARLTELAGRYYRILVAFNAGAQTAVYLRAVVEADVGGAYQPLYQGGLVYYNGEGLIDLGAVPIPPGGYDTLGTNITLKITAFRPTGASGSMTVDFVQFTPAGDGLFQRVQQPIFSAADGQAMVVNNIEGLAYLEDAGRHRPFMRLRGNPILLWPAQYNRIRILFNESGGFTAGRNLLAAAWYRKRRLDI